MRQDGGCETYGGALRRSVHQGGSHEVHRGRLPRPRRRPDRPGPHGRIHGPHQEAPDRKIARDGQVPGRGAHPRSPNRSLHRRERGRPQPRDVPGHAQEGSVGRADDRGRRARKQGRGGRRRGIHPGRRQRVRQSLHRRHIGTHAQHGDPGGREEGSTDRTEEDAHRRGAGRDPGGGIGETFGERGPEEGGGAGGGGIGHSVHGRDRQDLHEQGFHVAIGGCQRGGRAEGPFAVGGGYDDQHQVREREYGLHTVHSVGGVPCREAFGHAAGAAGQVANTGGVEWSDGGGPVQDFDGAGGQSPPPANRAPRHRGRHPHLPRRRSPRDRAHGRPPQSHRREHRSPSSPHRRGTDHGTPELRRRGDGGGDGTGGGQGAGEGEAGGGDDIE
mmetsp:Transcript_10485/g.22006  ORF Transcript_10485/g.22006 Transcript_10485/m.22006 type:complete len:387 (-) Transcript_10485:81-1241(-)